MRFPRRRLHLDPSLEHIFLRRQLPSAFTKQSRIVAQDRLENFGVRLEGTVDARAREMGVPQRWLAFGLVDPEGDPIGTRKGVMNGAERRSERV